MIDSFESLDLDINAIRNNGTAATSNFFKRMVALPSQARRNLFSHVKKLILVANIWFSPHPTNISVAPQYEFASDGPASKSTNERIWDINRTTDCS